MRGDGTTFRFNALQIFGTRRSSAEQPRSLLTLLEGRCCFWESVKQAALCWQERREEGRGACSDFLCRD